MPSTSIAPRNFGVGLVNEPIWEKVDESFNELTEAYPLMYRIFTDSSYCRMDDINGFIASVYENEQTPQNIQLDVINEISWARTKTPYIATSLSLTYILCEANRRQNREREKNIKVAFIRTKDFLHGHAFVALNELPLPNGDKEKLKYRNFANIQQTILVKGNIPRESIVHVISFQDLVDSLPKYFFRDGALDLKNKTFYSQVRNASLQFWANFEKGTQGMKGVSDMDARIVQGSKIALEIIIRPQLSKLDLYRTVQGGFNNFIEKSGALDVAMEFAQFPCPDNKQTAIKNHTDLHSEASKEHMKRVIAYGILLECTKKLLKHRTQKFVNTKEEE